MLPLAIARAVFARLSLHSKVFTKPLRCPVGCTLPSGKGSAVHRDPCLCHGRPLLAVPHILADESSAYYHGYVLAEMSVHQTRAYFKSKYGTIADNPEVGKQLTEVCHMRRQSTLAPGRQYTQYCSDYRATACGRLLQQRIYQAWGWLECDG